MLAHFFSQSSQAAAQGARLAWPCMRAQRVPEGKLGLLIGSGGAGQRVLPGAMLAPARGEAAWLVDPGPHSMTVVPFAQAPEIGLQLRWAIDQDDPRSTVQRWELFVASELDGALDADAFAAMVQESVAQALARGQLDLPPCTSNEEWHAFRAGLNQLLYVRFGITLDDGVPVDLGGSIDFAATLAARRQVQEVQAPAQATPAQPVATAARVHWTSAMQLVREWRAHRAELAEAAAIDAHVLRRLFLELPALEASLRRADPAPGFGLHAAHQAVLATFGRCTLEAACLPAFDLAAPGVELPAADRSRRAAASVDALSALEEGWALCAQIAAANQILVAPMLDSAERIAANLSTALGERRA